jgi:hypothetical protein
MFDVKSFIVKDDRFVITGIFDEKETAINNMLSKQAGNDNLLIRLLVFTQFFFSIITAFLTFKLLSPILQYFYFHSTRYQNIYRQIFTPPPQLSFS